MAPQTPEEFLATVAGVPAFGTPEMRKAFLALKIVPGQIASVGSVAYETMPRLKVAADRRKTMCKALLANFFAHAGGHRDSAITIFGAIIAARWPTLAGPESSVLGVSWGAETELSVQALAVLNGARPETAVYRTTPTVFASYKGSAVPTDEASYRAAVEAAGDRYEPAPIPALNVGDLEDPLPISDFELDAILGVLLWAMHQQYSADVSHLYEFRMVSARAVSNSDGSGVMGMLPEDAMIGWTKVCNLYNGRRALIIKTIVAIAYGDVTDEYRFVWANASLLSGQGLAGYYAVARLIRLDWALVSSIPILKNEAVLFMMMMSHISTWTSFDLAYKKAIMGSALTMYHARDVRNILGCAQMYTSTTRKAAKASKERDFRIVDKVKTAFVAALEARETLKSA